MENIKKRKNIALIVTGILLVVALAVGTVLFLKNDNNDENKEPNKPKEENKSEDNDKIMAYGSRTKTTGEATEIIAINDSGDISVIYTVESSEVRLAYNNDKLFVYIYTEDGDNGKIGYIDLNVEKENYELEIVITKLFDYNFDGLAAIDNKIFYNDNTEILQYDLDTKRTTVLYESEEEYINSVYSFDDKHIAIVEQVDEASKIQLLNIETADITTIYGDGYINASNNGKMLFTDYSADFITYFEYSNGKSTAVSPKIEDTGGSIDARVIVEYSGGYLYGADSSLFVWDGKEAKEVQTFDVPIDALNNLFMVSKNILRIEIQGSGWCGGLRDNCPDTKAIHYNLDTKEIEEIKYDYWYFNYIYIK